MSDPTPIKALDWHGFLRIPRRALHIETVERQHHPRRRLRGCADRPQATRRTVQAAADAGYIRLVGVENAAREESKGHLIRTWKRTRKAIPAHVCEVAA